MAKNIIKLLMIIFVITFIFLIIKYYFSDKNKNLVENNRNNLESIIQKNTKELPLLKNNTNNVIEFNFGFNDTNTQNFKRSFWDLFK